MNNTQIENEFIEINESLIKLQEFIHNQEYPNINYIEQDDFGLNTFDDTDDNYIVEAYNQDGDILVKSHLEITRKVIKPANFHVDLEELMHDYDMVIEDITMEMVDPAKIPEKTRLSYLIEELYRTEKQYLNGLHKIIHDYKPYVERKSGQTLQKKARLIFAYIPNLYRESRKFLAKLEMAGENLGGVCKAFNASPNLFKLYVDYSRNKPMADIYYKEFLDITKKRQNQLGDKLDLSSYLLTPIQRLGKYVLFLEKMLKEVDNYEISNDVRDVLLMLKKQMKNSNDQIAIGSVRNCPLDLRLKGSFCMREVFLMHKPKRFEAMVFLFENILVITHNNKSEQFAYFESIEMEDLTLGAFERDPLIFHLSNYPKCKTGHTERYTYVLEAKSTKIKHTWTTTIEQRLWQQLEKCKKDLKDKRYSTITVPICKRKNQLKTRSVPINTKFYDST